MGIQINGQTEIISSSDKSITLDDTLTLKNLTVTGTLTGPSVVPVGAVFHFAASSAPAGYLKCNGDVVPNGTGTVQGITANFSALYNILGTTYGSLGKLPDLRGEFVRGWDDLRGIDSGRSFGSAQSGSRVYVPKNSGQATTVNGAQPNEPSPYSSFYDETFTGGYLVDTAFGITKTYGSTSTADTLGTIRPRNVALLACIKY